MNLTGNKGVPAEPGAPAQTTTKRREWLGWYGSMSWLFFMMYGYQQFIFGDLISGDTGDFASFIFMAVCAVSIAVFAWRYGRDPGGLSKIALCATPAAIAMTAVFPLLPGAPGEALYILSSVFMAPAITRRVYGVIRTSKSGRALTPYMLGVVAGVVSFAFLMMAGPPAEIAFIFPALLALPAWFGVRLSISVPGYRLDATPFKLSKRMLALFTAAIAVIILLDAEYAVLHTYLARLSYDTSEGLLVALSFVLPPLGFLLYAFISDKGHERSGFIFGMGLLLIGLLFSLAQESVQSAIFVPLFVADNLGGAYLEFFILTAPIFLIARAKRSVFVASLGVVLNLASSALLWIAELVLPEFMMVVNTPMILATTIVTVLVIMAGFIVFDRHSERTLAAALYSMLRGAGPDGDAAGSGAGMAAGSGFGAETDGASAAAAGFASSAQTKNMIEAGLTQDEIKVALLLIDGNTRTDILRKLRISADEVGKYENAIRHKICAMGGVDPAVGVIAEEYKLTKREAEILGCMRREMTNPEIAAALFVSEATVKGHVHNLLGKLNIETRRQLDSWFMEREENKSHT